jgi:hypothetical protein
MGTWGQLRRIGDRLIRDLEETTISLSMLGKKYGVTKQAIFRFCKSRGIKRPKREHTEKCSICQGLIRIAKKPHSDFISSHTNKTQLGLGRREFFNHIRILRKKGLISEKFGRLLSRKVERAYQIYFKRRLPIRTIGRQAGLKNFQSTIQRHKASGWDVPAPLFKFDSAYRRKILKMIKKKRRG